MPCLLTVFCPSFPFVSFAFLAWSVLATLKKKKGYSLHFSASKIFLHDQSIYFLSKWFKNYLNVKANQLSPGHFYQSDCICNRASKRQLSFVGDWGLEEVEAVN